MGDVWKCRALQGFADPPQDCDWPFCGCDPHAVKVIEALVECGWSPPPDANDKTRLADPERNMEEGIIMNDRLTDAIEGTERGERWETEDGVLELIDGAWVLRLRWPGNAIARYPPASGWHRVDEPLKCPEGHQASAEMGADGWRVRCNNRGCWWGPVLTTEAEAREAWGRIGGLKWHRVDEKPPREGRYVVWWANTQNDCVGWNTWNDGEWEEGIDGHEESAGMIAWMDPPPPPWAKDVGNESPGRFD